MVEALPMSTILTALLRARRLADVLDGLAETRESILVGPGGAHRRGAILVLSSERARAVALFQLWIEVVPKELELDGAIVPPSLRAGLALAPAALVEILKSSAESADEDRALAESFRRWAREVAEIDGVAPQRHPVAKL